MFRISIVLFVVAAEVTCWTIDLPEARKFLFEKNELLEKKRLEEGHKYRTEERVLFSNREDSNSKHHEHHYDEHEQGEHYEDDDNKEQERDEKEYEEKEDLMEPHERPYAREYGYQSYNEKEVLGAVYSGGEYLEGLRRALEAYETRLQACTTANGTYFMNGTAFNMTSMNMTSLNMTSDSRPWAPMVERVYNASDRAANMSECARATRTREHVRRLAALATRAASELQDLAYSSRHMKEDPRELSQRENELVLKLAWLLDRLAQFTGYRPHPQRYKDRYSTSSTTASPVVATMLNASGETTRRMMGCLQQKSDVPATERCAYPQEIPGAFQFVLNNSNPIPGGAPSSSNRQERVLPPSPSPSRAPSPTRARATSEQELLIATDYRPHYPHYPHYLSYLRKRRDTSPDTQTNMAAEHPAVTFMKYFVKHKIWEGDNPTHKQTSQRQPFDVSNEIPHTIHKRTVTKLKLPENPYQDLSEYVKSKKGVNYVKDEAQARKINDYINKIQNTKPASAKEHSRRISKYLRSQYKSNELNSRLRYSKSDRRSKRSYTYERDVDKPRQPDDLFKDISYYVKNKPGTNTNRDVVQASQLRAGLAAVFANPGIETVRRYGANFNPLVPDPLLFASLRSAADN